MMKKEFYRHAVKAAMTIALFATMPFAGVSAQTAEPDLDAKYATTLPKVSSVAPDFALKTADGKTVRLSDFRGRYVVLDFWASWCPDCRKDAPQIARLHKEYAERGVEFVGISFDVNKEAWMKAVKTYNLSYTHVSELKKMNQSAVAKAYGVNWIPSVCLVAPDGKIVLSTVMADKLASELARLFPACAE